MLLKDRVKGILEDDYDLVESIIYELGFCNLKEYGGYWRFGYDETSNPSALRLYKGSLNFKNYKYHDKSGAFTLWYNIEEVATLKKPLNT